MSTVRILTADDREKGSLPIFQEIERRFDNARRRAYELFEQRGGEAGRDWEDWLQAEREVFGDAVVKLEEKAGQMEIEIHLEGFVAPETEVTATPTEIVIHAKHQEKNESEQRTREVVRRMELQKPVRPDQVSAKLENGVLRIVAPVSGQALNAGAPAVTVAVA